MAEIRVYVGEDQLLPDGMGLGFYANDFAMPIALDSFNNRTYVTNASGLQEGYECNNNKWISSTGVIHGQAGSGMSLLSLPNIHATINLRFINSFPVRTQLVRFHIYDGSDNGDGPNKDVDPTGLTCYCAEIRHTSQLQTETGIGDSSWQDTHGATHLPLISSPGASGLRPDGSFTEDTRHDWYVAMSASPNIPGNKYFGMYCELEYL